MTYEFLNVRGLYPDITTLNDGSLVVTWYSPELLLYIQRFNGEGAPITGAFEIVVAPGSGLPFADLIPSPQGGFLLVTRVDETTGFSRTHGWLSFNAQLTLADPYYRLVDGYGPWSYGHEGVALVNGYVVSASTYEGNGWDVGLDVRSLVGDFPFSGPVMVSSNGTQTGPEVKALADGVHALVVWSDDSGALDTDGYGVYGRIFSTASMSFVSAPFLINQGVAGDQAGIPPWETVAGLATAPLRDGGFFVAWLDRTKGDLRARIFGGSSEGFQPRTDEFLATLTTSETEHFPDAVILSDGTVLLTYVVLDSSGLSTLMGRQFNASGQVIRDEFSIAETREPKPMPTVSALGANQIVVAWQTGATVVDAQGPRSKFAIVDLPEVAVLVEGVAQEGGVLTARLSNSLDLTAIASISYQWQEEKDGDWIDLAGEVSASLNIPSDQSLVGGTIRVLVNTTNADGITAQLASYARIVSNVNDEPTGIPSITGITTHGEILSANTSDIADSDGIGAFSYVWKADGTVIAGATASTLVLGQPQVGKAITVEVSYTDLQGMMEGPLVSSATALVLERMFIAVRGSGAADTLLGASEQNLFSRFQGLGGNDSLIGGNRSDVAAYSGNRSDYTIRTVGGVTTITDNRTDSPDGVDTLRGLNVLQFADTVWFQSAAANRTTLAGGAQRFMVENGAFVTGTNAAEHFVVSGTVNASVSTGSGDTLDLPKMISSYTFRASGNQLQVSDGVHTVWLTVPGNPLTLRTASGSTTVAIDFASGGVIKLGGTQVVGSPSFDGTASILNADNVSEQARGVPPAAAQMVRQTGTSEADSLSGDSQVLTYFEGGGGNDTLVGGNRSDVAVYSGNRSSYTVRTVAGITTVIDNRSGSPDGSDTLRGINVLQFADGFLFQNSAANRTTLGGSAQRYGIQNGEYVIGTNAIEQFVVADDVSTSIATGAGDVVDLTRSIEGYSFRAVGTQLQISDGVHLIAIAAPSTPLTLRTASGSTTVAIDFAAGSVIKLGGIQVVGSATFDAAAAILDPTNTSTKPIVLNHRPSLSTFGTSVKSTLEDSSVPISFQELLARGDEADVDGAVTSFIVKSVSGGSLTINGTPWSPSSNAMIDPNKSAVWTPIQNTNGTFSAFSVVAKDNSGDESTAPVQFLIAVQAVNDRPTLTSFGASLKSTLEDTAVPVFFSELISQGDEADVDGTVTAFVVKTVTSGALQINGVAFDPVSNNTIDANSSAIWTPPNNLSGSMGAFTIVAKDDVGSESSPAVLARIEVAPVNDIPTLTSFGSLSRPTLKDIPVSVSFAELLARGNEADIDGGVTAFVVKAVSTGSLEINGLPWNAVSNNVIDGNNSAVWTPAANAIGFLEGFAAVARDNGGDQSLGAVSVVFTVLAEPDTVAPKVVTFNPADGETGFPVARNIVLTFSEPIKRGPGLIYLLNGSANGPIIETFDRNSARVTIAGNTVAIDPSSDLGTDSLYFVRITDGSFQDASENNYAEAGPYGFRTVAANSPSASVYLGTEADDRLSASSEFPFVKKIYMYGYGGNDLLKGAFLHVNYIYGGAGDDVLQGGAGQNFVWGEGGNDVIDTWQGEYGELYGGDGDDRITGGDAGGVLDGGVGNDRMTGGGGPDVYVVDSLGDQIFDSYAPFFDNDPNPVDVVRSSITWTLGVNIENLELTGKADIDGSGNELSNVISGNIGSNVLTGGAGNDTLDGRAGKDVLIGGSGADFFDFTTTLNEITNVDTIIDFNVLEDQIRLDNAVMEGLGALIGPLSADAFLAGPGRVSAADASDRIIFDTLTGDLYYDADGTAGSATAIKIATLGGGAIPNLEHTHFSVI